MVWLLPIGLTGSFLDLTIGLSSHGIGCKICSSQTHMVGSWDIYTPPEITMEVDFPRFLVPWSSDFYSHWPSPTFSQIAVWLWKMMMTHWRGALFFGQQRCLPLCEAMCSKACQGLQPFSSRSGSILQLDHFGVPLLRSTNSTCICKNEGISRNFGCPL